MSLMFSKFRRIQAIGSAGVIASAVFASAAFASSHQSTKITNATLTSCNELKCVYIESPTMIGGLKGSNYVIDAAKITIVEKSSQTAVHFTSDNVFYDGSHGFIYIRGARDSGQKEAVYSLKTGKLVYFK